MKAEEIAEIFGRSPNTAQTAHAPRMTRAGAQLPGHYASTYVVFPLDVSGYEYPDQYLAAHLAQPQSGDPHAIRRAVDAGCKVEYFFGISCPGNSGFELDAALIQAIHRSGASLSFDIYGCELD
jgi:hypothetical protein